MFVDGIGSILAFDHDLSSSMEVLVIAQVPNNVTYRLSHVDLKL